MIAATMLIATIQTVLLIALVLMVILETANHVKVHICSFIIQKTKPF